MVVDCTVMGTGVVAGLDDRPRDVDDTVALLLATDTGRSFDGVDARESLSLLPVLSGFFGLLATAVKFSEIYFRNKGTHLCAQTKTTGIVKLGKTMINSIFENTLCIIKTNIFTIYKFKFKKSISPHTHFRTNS